jgi:hypothetical protein
LLSVLLHFFEQGRSGSVVQTAIEEQSLTAEDQLFILVQAAKRDRFNRPSGTGLFLAKTVFLTFKIRSNIIGRELFNRTLAFLKRHERMNSVATTNISGTEKNGAKLRTI